MTPLHNLPIKFKLSGIMLIVSLMLLGLTAIALITNESIRLRNNLSNELMTLAAMMEINTRAGLVFDDEKAVNDVLTSLRAQPYITVAHVFNQQGKRVTSYFKDSNIARILPATTKELEQEFILHEGKITQQKEGFFLHADHAEVFKEIHLDDERLLGFIFIESNLEQFHQVRTVYIQTVLSVMSLALAVALILGVQLQKILTEPLYRLLATIATVASNQDYSLRTSKTADDEIGTLIDSFNKMLEKIEKSNLEIILLNGQLQEENQRMGAELDITRQLQQMVLPTREELQQIRELDIAGFMEPAEEVGGDYYDVLQTEQGVKIGIGDVTGHGLESGVVMLMVQMAVRTLLENRVSDPAIFLTTLNRAIFGNVKRMNTDKNLTLALLDYQAGKLSVAGQHEEILIVRQNGTLERLDTIDLGFMIGVVSDITDFVQHREIELGIGEGVVLYTDGITEARNAQKQCYGIERLCQVIMQHWSLPSVEIETAIVHDLHRYLGSEKILDDVTLLILKRMA